MTKLNFILIDIDLSWNSEAFLLLVQRLYSCYLTTTTRKFGFRLSLRCFVDLISPVAPWTLSRLSLLQKYVPRRVPGGWSRAVPRADKLATFMCRLCINPGNLYLLKPSRPAQACLYIPAYFYEQPYLISFVIFKEFCYFLCIGNALFKTHHFTKKK